MKKSFFILLFSSVLSLSFSQINVSTSGKVTIGATTDATEELEVQGDALITGDVSAEGDLNVSGDVHYANSDYSYLPGIEIHAMGYTGMTLRPTTNNHNYLGNSSHAFNSVFAYNCPIPSDIRQKENIKEIDNALSIIMQLTGVTYDLKKEFAYMDSIPYTAVQLNKLEKRRKNIYGFIAQDIEKILPTTVHYDDTTDTYAVDYVKVIPVLASAIKEQQSIITNLSNQVDLLQQELIYNELKKSAALEVDNMELTNAPILYQNNPNPFSESTIIKYNLPEAIEKASIIIYDMNGKQIKSITLSTRGESQVSITAGEFDAGMYLYSLLANGQLIDTKQMVITE